MTRTITQVQELEFAIQDSRRQNTIIRVCVPDLAAAEAYLTQRYDCGVNADNQGGEDGLDVWACEGDWRLFLL